MTNYETIASIQAYQGRIFDVSMDRVRMPDGNIEQRDVVRHLNAVAVVAMRYVGEGNRMLISLVQQYRHPLGERILELPAGLMDNPDQDAEQTARRELVEEIGFEAKKMVHLCTIASSPGFTDERVHIYLATDLSEVGRPEAIDEEADLTVKWVTLRWATTEIFRGGIISAHTVAGILAAKEYLE